MFHPVNLIFLNSLRKVFKHSNVVMHGKISLLASITFYYNKVNCYTVIFLLLCYIIASPLNKLFTRAAC